MSKGRKDQRHSDSVDYWLAQVKRASTPDAAAAIIDRMTQAATTHRVWDAVIGRLEELDGFAEAVVQKAWNRASTPPDPFGVPTR